MHNTRMMADDSAGTVFSTSCEFIELPLGGSDSVPASGTKYRATRSPSPGGPKVSDTRTQGCNNHRCHDESEMQNNLKCSTRQPQSCVTAGRLKLGSTRSSSSSNNSINSKSSSASCDDDKTLIYVTQYSIDHDQQSDGLCREVMFEECVPFCNAAKRREHCNSWKIVVWLIWAFVSSELFLYSLHVTSIVIGALKEVLTLRRKDPELALINSSVETSATLLLILIRMANAYIGYRQVREAVRHEENFNPDKDIHVRLLKRWMIFFELIAFTLFGFSLSCFIVFYYHIHLGWTILSNNLCLITILVMANLYRARVVLAITRIREDQYKVVIYEAILIIEETKRCCRPNGDHQPADEDDVNHEMFINAVRTTTLFTKPNYIGVIKHV